MDDMGHEKIWIEIEALKAEQRNSFYVINLILKDIKKDMSLMIEKQKAQMDEIISWMTKTDSHASG